MVLYSGEKQLHRQVRHGGYCGENPLQNAEDVLPSSRPIPRENVLNKTDDIFEDGLYAAGHSAEGGDGGGGALPCSAEEAGQSVHEVAAEKGTEQGRYDGRDGPYHGRDDGG